MDEESPDPYGLRRISLTDRAVFESFFRGTRARISDYSFACCFMWAEPIHLKWRVLKDHLCVFANGHLGLTLVMPPIGEGDLAAAAREAVDVCRQFSLDHGINGNAAMEYVSADIAQKLGSGFLAEPMSGDYVYATERLIKLEGKDLASKRHDRNRYMKRYAARTEPFGHQHVQACLEVQRRWQDQHADTADSLGQAARLKRSKESLAAAEAIIHCDQIGLVGMVLYAGDELVGFTFGEMLDSDTCSILVEKTDRNFAGSAQYIFSEFCRQFWAHTTWCNVGDDWDVPSLARAKQSYRPAYRLEKWRLIPLPGAYVPVQAVETPGAIPAEPVSSDEEAPQGAVLADLAALEMLERDCFEAPLALRRRQLRRLLQTPTASIQVIRRNGTVIGEAIVLRRRTPGGLTARLYSLAVHRDHRGRGLGRMLLDRCISQAVSEGAGRLTLEVEADNHAAQALYRQVGFVETHRLPDYYGPGKDGLRMVLTFVPAMVEAPSAHRSDSPAATCPV